MGGAGHRPQAEAMKLRIIPLVVVFSALLAGCATDGGRWASANREDVVIEDLPYRVVWLRTPDGIDAHSNKNSFGITMLPDPLLEKRRAMEAMRLVASRECQGAATPTNETSVDLSFTAQWRCQPGAPAAPARRRG